MLATECQCSGAMAKSHFQWGGNLGSCWCRLSKWFGRMPVNWKLCLVCGSLISTWWQRDEWRYFGSKNGFWGLKNSAAISSKSSHHWKLLLVPVGWFLCGRSYNCFYKVWAEFFILPETIRHIAQWCQIHSLVCYMSGSLVTKPRFLMKGVCSGVAVNWVIDEF